MENIYTVYAEMTPNPSVMKFVSNKPLVASSEVYQFEDPDNVGESELLYKLFNFPFVESIMVKENFISITKNDLVDWEDISLELRSFIQDHLRSGKPLFKEENLQATIAQESINKTTTEEKIPETDQEKRIVEILKEYVTPAVAQDGGDIRFKSFKEGVLEVEMRGACNGCPSSTATLQNGIEGLFRNMMPEVKKVVPAQ